MRIGSLFSGIGGLELGLERAGVGETVWQVEQNEFCRRVLSKHWPSADRSVTDVRAAGRSLSLSTVDLICGGFPCQDVSSAGAGAGLSGARSGLWYEYLRIVGELRPGRVVVENVASGAKRWLCEVRGNLHAIGYRTRAFALSAAEVGAPYLRRRIFVVATDAYGDVVRVEQGRGGGPEGKGEPFPSEHGDARVASCIDGESKLAFAVNAEVAEPSATSGANGPRFSRAGDSGRGWPRPSDGHWRTPQPPMVRVVSRVPRRLDSARARIAALGNCVIPQCAEVVGRMIVEGYA
jgi:DNA (cytosine-5)-methyltransferase 1